jgi:hypothetical protein
MQLAAVASAVVPVLVALSAPAAAQAPGADPYSLAPSLVPPAPPPERRVTRYYAGQVVLSDLAAICTAAATGGEKGFVTGAVIYAGVPGLIHIAHGNTNSAWKSIGLRLGLPTLAVIALDSAGSCDGPDCEPNPTTLVLGGTVGGVTAMIVDWAVLAKRTERVRAATWAPSVAMTPDAVSVGAIGRF